MNGQEVHALASAHSKANKTESSILATLSFELTDYRTINEQGTCDTLQTIRIRWMLYNTELSTNENEAYGKLTKATQIADYDYVS